MPASDIRYDDDGNLEFKKVTSYKKFMNTFKNAGKYSLWNLSVFARINFIIRIVDGVMERLGVDNDSHGSDESEEEEQDDAAMEDEGIEESKAP